MYNFLNKCFNPSLENCRNEETDGRQFLSCNNVDDIDTLNDYKIDGGNIDFCRRNRNLTNGSRNNNYLGTQMNEKDYLNEYRENNFNYIFGIDPIEFPLHIYKHIFFNFFTSFMDIGPVINGHIKNENENENEKDKDKEKQKLKLKQNQNQKKNHNETKSETETETETETDKETEKTRRENVNGGMKKTENKEKEEEGATTFKFSPKGENGVEDISYEDVHLVSKVYSSLKKQKFVLLHKAISAPHQRKQIMGNYKNGDALICCDNIIAIADGVSSINNLGINVSNFSNNILKNCLNLHLYKCINYDEFVKQNEHICKIYDLKYKPKEILKPLVCRSACSANFLGASTLLFASLEKNKLHICNIGDSQMLIIRLKGMLLHSDFLKKIKLKVLTTDNVLYFVEEKYKKTKDINYTELTRCGTKEMKNNFLKETDMSLKTSTSDIDVSESLNNVHLDDTSKKEKENEESGIKNVESLNSVRRASENDFDMNKDSEERDRMTETKRTYETINGIRKEKSNFIKSCNILNSIESMNNKKNKSNVIKSCNILNSIQSINNKKGKGSDEKKFNESIFNIANVYPAQTNQVYYNDILNDLNLNVDSQGEPPVILLYVEKELKKKKEPFVKQYLKNHNYKIGNLLFEIEKYEEEIMEEPLIESNFLKSSSFSSTSNFPTADDVDVDDVDVDVERIEEKKKMEERIKKMKEYDDMCVNDVGVRNLINFFDMDATKLNKMRHTSNSENDKSHKKERKKSIYRKKHKEKEKEKHKHKEKEKEKHKHKEKEKEKEGNEKKKEEKKGVMSYNNYRFRFKDKDTGIFDIIYKSKIQQHYFNCPYQISSLPKNLQ